MPRCEMPDRRRLKGLLGRRTVFPVKFDQQLHEAGCIFRDLAGILKRQRIFVMRLPNADRLLPSPLLKFKGWLDWPN